MQYHSVQFLCASFIVNFLSLITSTVHSFFPFDFPVFVMLYTLPSSLCISLLLACQTGEIQWITAGSMPTDRATPQCPHTTASDPGPILLPRLVGQPWLLSAPSHSVP